MKLLVIGDEKRFEKYLPDLDVVSRVEAVVAPRGATDEQMERFDDSFDAVFRDEDEISIDTIYNPRKFVVKSDSIDLKIDADRTDLVRFEKINGTMCAVIELEGEVEVNGVSL